MSAEANKQVVVDHLNLAWNQGEFNELANHVTKNFYYQTTFTDNILNFEQYVQYVKSFREAIPDINLDIEEVMAENGRVMSHVSFSGTVQKSVFGIPASDRIIAFPAISLWDVRQGKVASLSTLVDMTSVSRQVGVSLDPEETIKIW